jgi:hypothetical protein
MSLRVQSILFPKSKFTLKTAKSWLISHGYKISYYGKPIQSETNFWRSRQRKPNKNYKYVTEILPNGIRLVLFKKNDSYL